MDPPNEEGGEGEESSSISAQLGEFLANSGFDDKLYQFLEDEVAGLTIAEEGEEQALQVFEVYQKFTQLFDGEFTEFMGGLGISSMEEMSQRLAEEDSTDERASQFFEKLLASMEYESFVTLARNFNEADDDDNDNSDDDDDDDEANENDENP